MDHPENEDPEDRLERMRREKSNQGLRRVATQAGWVSVISITFAFLLFIGMYFLSVAITVDEAFTFLGNLGLVCIGLIAPVASMVSLVSAACLWWRKEKAIDEPTILALPGAVLGLLSGLGLMMILA